MGKVSFKVVEKNKLVYLFVDGKGVGSVSSDKLDSVKLGKLVELEKKYREEMDKVGREVLGKWIVE
jgi:hypothetical protein